MTEPEPRSIIAWTPEKLAEAHQRMFGAAISLWSDMAAQLLVFYGEIPPEFTAAAHAIIERYHPKDAA